MVPGLEVSEVSAPRGVRQRVHDHERAFVCFVLAGPYEERIGGRSLRHDPGAVLLHPPATRHADALPPGGRLFGLRLDGPWARRLRQVQRFDGPLEGKPGSEASWLMARLRAEWRRVDACSPMAIEGLLLECLAALGRPAASCGAPSWIRRAEEAVRARAHGTVHVAALARELGVEPGRLARAFRRAHGTSLTGYVRRLRVEEACRQIAGGASLADAAALSGFADQSHLTRIFRRVTGTTPAAWRRALTSR